MDATKAKAILQEASGTDEPAVLPRSVLRQLTAADVPDGIRIQVGHTKGNIIHLDWEGFLFKHGAHIHGEAEYIWTRKYWYAPIGLEHYLDLVRRAVEVRTRDHGDVELTHYDDDGAYIQLSFSISCNETNLSRAYRHIRRICGELEGTAENAADQVGKQLAAIAGRLSGWGSGDLNTLVDTVEKASSTDQRGRSLEELVVRLFESVPGFAVTSRIRTATEEIDISVLNDNPDPRFRRESAILLAECKNWSGKCGKNEFVLFKQKIANRSGRCSLGFLISWNGFRSTVTKELLRGSREQVLVIPMTGKEIREAVQDGDFLRVLTASWEKAVNT